MRTRFIKKAGEKVFALAASANAATQKVAKYYDDYKNSASCRVLLAEMQNDSYYC